MKGFDGGAVNASPSRQPSHMVNVLNRSVIGALLKFTTALRQGVSWSNDPLTKRGWGKQGLQARGVVADVPWA